MTPSVDYKAYPILIVDDDQDIVATFRFNFERDFTVIGVTSGRDAVATLEARPVAVLVADQRMPDMQGIEVIRRALEIRPDVIPIVLTGFTDFQVLVKAINIGRIYRYIPKPWETEELRLALCTAVEAYHLAHENARLLAELAAANERLTNENRFYKQRETDDARLDSIVGTSDALEQVRLLIRRVLNASATVLLEGASGTGKELVARAIHYAGPRRDKLFVPVNCGAITDSLLESELFGHRRGAFTGAVSDRKGLFQLADGGTLFLDEIGEASPAFQIHLLRVLEDRYVRPVGDTRTIPVDVRVVAATNRDLEEAAREGRFREDLLFRLRVFPLRLPPLSERREDIPLLVRHFLERHARALKRPLPALAPEAWAELERREYRGNVRELANLIERALLLTDPDETILAEHLFDRPIAAAVAAPTGDGRDAMNLYGAVGRFEKAHIAEALARSQGSRARAAREMGISYRWLIKKMQKYSLAGTREERVEDEGE